MLSSSKPLAIVIEEGSKFSDASIELVQALKKADLDFAVYSNLEQAEKEQATLSANVEVEKKAFTHVNAELMQAKEELKDAEGVLSSKEKELVGMKSALDESKSKLAGYKSDISAKNKEFADLDSQLQSLEENARNDEQFTLSTVADFETKLEAGKIAVEKVKGDIAKKESEIEAAKKSLQVLEETQRANEAALGEVTVNGNKLTQEAETWRKARKEKFENDERSLRSSNTSAINKIVNELKVSLDKVRGATESIKLLAMQNAQQISHAEKGRVKARLVELCGLKKGDYLTDEKVSEIGKLCEFIEKEPAIQRKIDGLKSAYELSVSEYNSNVTKKYDEAASFKKNKSNEINDLGKRICREGELIRENEATLEILNRGLATTLQTQATFSKMHEKWNKKHAEGQCTKFGHAEKIEELQKKKAAVTAELDALKYHEKIRNANTEELEESYEMRRPALEAEIEEAKEKVSQLSTAHKTKEAEFNDSNARYREANKKMAYKNKEVLELKESHGKIGIRASTEVFKHTCIIFADKAQTEAVKAKFQDTHEVRVNAQAAANSQDLLSQSIRSNQIKVDGDAQAKVEAEAVVAANDNRSNVQKLVDECVSRTAARGMTTPVKGDGVYNASWYLKFGFRGAICGAGNGFFTDHAFFQAATQSETALKVANSPVFNSSVSLVGTSIVVKLDDDGKKFLAGMYDQLKAEAGWVGAIATSVGFSNKALAM